MHALLMHYIIINANFCLLCFEGYCVKRPHWIIIMIPVIIKKYNCLLSYVVSRVCIACTVITVSSVSICLFNNKKREKNEIQCKVFSVHGSSGLTVLIPV